MCVFFKVNIIQINTIQFSLNSIVLIYVIHNLQLHYNYNADMQ